MLVFEYKVISYEYFMFEMQEYELYLLCEMFPWSVKHEYEQMRQIVYATLLPHTKKGFNKTPQDIFPLYTDEKHITELSKEGLDEARKQIKNMNWNWNSNKS